jgi:two-component system osmolarity sensor histidine kinase EnvZ
MLLIALLLAVGQFAALRLFDYFEREPRAVAAALQATSVVNLTRAALLAAQENRRIALLSDFSGREGIHIYAVDFMETVEPLPNDPYIQMIAAVIRQRLGEDTLVTLNHLGLPGLWVSFSIGQDDFWVVIPRIQILRPFPWQWLGWVGLVALLSLVGAYLIAARINRPLRQLAAAANKLRQGETPHKLPVAGTEEMREVNHTFNEMSAALARLDTERRLLLAGVSHDLRTPLARLRLAVEMLPDEETASLKNGMVKDITDMDEIISQFLDFVRGVEGEPSQMIDINTLLKELAERHIRAGRQLHLKLAPTHLASLRPLAMQRLLDNLVDNAFAYSAGEVTVRTEITASSIIVSVLDNGPGIPLSQMVRLLRPFERLDTARGNEGGSGLGLAIADRIAKLHKGQLELINRPQGGLEARVTLPI